MVTLSTRQAARKLGIDPMTLSRYIRYGKVPPPKMLEVGSASLHAWTEADVERIRQLLPKIANGRKTRYKKKQLAIGSQQLAKAKKTAKAKAKSKTQPGAAVPHEQSRLKKTKPPARIDSRAK